MPNVKPAHSRRKRRGPRCIRCIKAKKGPCSGTKPTCDRCGSMKLLCVWDDEGEKGYDANNELKSVGQEQPVKAPLPVRASSVQMQNDGAVHLAPGPPAQKHNVDEDSTYGSGEPVLKRKRGRPAKDTELSLGQTTYQTDDDVTVTEQPRKKQKLIQRPIAIQRTKLIHTEVIKYKAQSFKTLINDSPPRLPIYMESSPLNTPRYPSPLADFTQASQLFQPEREYVLYFPRIYIDTEEIEIGPFDDGEDEWRRLAPEVDGGWMAYPNGRWVQEGVTTFRWVR